MTSRKHRIVFLPFPKLSAGNDDDGANIVMDHQVMGAIERELEWEQTYSPRTGSGFTNPKVLGYKVNISWEDDEPVFPNLSAARQRARELSERHAEEALSLPTRWRILDSKESATLLKLDEKEPFLREEDRQELRAKTTTHSRTR
jgi:hypothetical protein